LNEGNQKNKMFFSKEPKKKKIFKAAFFAFFLAAAGLSFFVAMNLEIVKFSKEYLYSDCNLIPKSQAVIILGAKVQKGGSLSDMYKDRADAAIEIYRKGKAEKIIVSGDHGGKEYDEVNAAKKYLLEQNIPAKDIFLDHAGFDTYDSLYRARDIFQVEQLIISTQDFHLSRAVYIARKLGIEAFGIRTDRHIYGGENFYQAREALARIKAHVEVFCQAKPKFLGEPIPITGSSQPSWDE